MSEKGQVEKEIGAFDEALRELSMAKECESPVAAQAFASCAQAYASLAIAEQLERLNSNLERGEACVQVRHG